MPHVSRKVFSCLVSIGFGVWRAASLRLACHIRQWIVGEAFHDQETEPVNTAFNITHLLSISRPLSRLPQPTSHRHDLFCPSSRPALMLFPFPSRRLGAGPGRVMRAVVLSRTTLSKLSHRPRYPASSLRRPSVWEGLILRSIYHLTPTLEPSRVLFYVYG